MKVEYTFAEDVGHFMFHDSDGKEHVVEAGKNYSTSDQGVQSYLDSVPQVKRVKKEKG